MKNFLIIFVFIFLCFVLVGCGSSNTITNTVINNFSTNENTSSEIYDAEKINIEPKEEVVSSFSTNILDKDTGRQTNISITCSTLNGTIVKAGDTFSFCDTVGKATVDRGYKEAKVFDADGNITMGLRWWQLPSK